MDLQSEQINFGPDAGFHMLRHFHNVSARMMEVIRKKGYRKSQIDQMLKAPGSRFSGYFAQSIDELIDRLFKYPYTESNGLTGNLELSWDIPEDEWPDGIGTSSVVSIQTLNKFQSENLYKKANRGVSLWHVDVDTLPSTSQCTLILKPIDTNYMFITAFPGKATIPLPDKRMSTELLGVCNDYWERHVFLVVGA